MCELVQTPSYYSLCVFHCMFLSLGLSVSMLQTSQKPQVEDLQLVVQLHADDAVVSVYAEQDACRLAVLSQDHLHLNAHNTTFNMDSLDRSCSKSK